MKPFPGPGGKTQVSANGGRLPAWGRGEIFFVDLDSRLQTAAYSSSGSEFHTSPSKPWGNLRIHQLLLTRNYDVMPDGKHVIALLDEEYNPGAKTPGQITVLLNFFDELVRKVGKK